MVLATGVPVAKTTPLPPPFFWRYRTFWNMSQARCESELGSPLRRPILVVKRRFLNMSASSTNIWSMPSSSKNMVLSAVSETLACVSLSLASSFTSAFCISLCVLPEPLSIASASMAPRSSSTSSRRCSASVSGRTGSFRNWESDTITASQSPVAMRLMNSGRRSGVKSLSSGNSTLAPG